MLTFSYIHTSNNNSGLAHLSRCACYTLQIFKFSRPRSGAQRGRQLSGRPRTFKTGKSRQTFRPASAPSDTGLIQQWIMNSWQDDFKAVVARHLFYCWGASPGVRSSCMHNASFSGIIRKHCCWRVLPTEEFIRWEVLFSLVAAGEVLKGD